jgi:hypothetical protein
MSISKFGLIFVFFLYQFFLFTSPTLAQNLGPGASGPIQLQQLLTRIINLAGPAAFIVLTVMLVVAGIKFLTSGGDPKAIGSASQTATWAILGIIFLVLAWLILLLIEAATGVKVSIFCIGIPGGPNPNNCQ